MVGETNAAFDQLLLWLLIDDVTGYGRYEYEMIRYVWGAIWLLLIVSGLMVADDDDEQWLRMHAGWCCAVHSLSCSLMAPVAPFPSNWGQNGRRREIKRDNNSVLCAPQACGQWSREILWSSHVIPWYSLSSLIASRFTQNNPTHYSPLNR